MKRPFAFIIDDQVENIRMFEEVLQIVRYSSIKSALNGREALQWLELHDAPDLILLDINLPEVDGLEIYHYLRGEEKFNQTCVVVVTANPYMAKIVQDELIEGDYILPKPVNLAQLHDIARKVSKPIA